MFDKLKQISQLKKLQSKMKEEKVVSIQRGVQVTMNGNFEVEEIILNKELSQEEQALVLKDCFNKAAKDVQIKIAQNFSGLII